MKQLRFRTRTILCALLCLLCVMTGCAGEYPAQPDVALQETYTEGNQSTQIEATQIDTAQTGATQTEAEQPETTEAPVAVKEEMSETISASEDSITESSEEIPTDGGQDNAPQNTSDSKYIDREGSYTTAEDVALYLYTYDELPDNFMTKEEARELGWSGGSLEKYAPGMCIGGDYFGNREGLLPEEKGRDYYECDIDTLGAKSRGAKRIVYSDDGLIYYTEDHYESFTLLYGEE